MATNKLNNLNTRPEKDVNFLVPILILGGVVSVFGLGFVWFENGLGESIKNFYLLPWVFLVGAVVLSPTAFLIYKKKFDPFHQLIFAAWTYIFPAFVLGGVIISFDLVSPYFMTFIEDPEYNLPLALVYVALGFIGLSVGFALPLGKYCAEKLEPRLPKWNWKPEQVWLGGLFLLLVGVGVNILGFVQGLLGFQRNVEVNMFDGLISFLLIVLTTGTVLLWLAIFSTKERSPIYYLILVVLIMFVPLRMVVLGSRGGLTLGLLLIAMAFVYSGRRLKWQTTVAFMFIGIIAILIGTIYGTAFRNIKGSEGRMNAGDYFGQVGATIEYLSSEDPVLIVEQSAQALADRVENLSSLGVVVANYEKLSPYEASYGLENNIFNDLYTSFIPRFVWQNKPPTSDARAYSDLYFNYSENSFAISPFGDLLRNFGPVGVPLGMLILGIYLRFIYVALIDTPNPAMWKKVAYFPLLTVVSYEAFYATIFPSAIRTFFIIGICLFLANLLVRKGSNDKFTPQI